MRVFKLTRDGSATLYLQPDFQIKDGVAKVQVMINRMPLLELESPWSPEGDPLDLAPLQASGDVFGKMFDGEVTAGDAWVRYAAREGILELDEELDARGAEEALKAASNVLVHDDDQAHRSLFYNHLGTLIASDVDGALDLFFTYPFGEQRYATSRGQTEYYALHERDGSGLVYGKMRYLSPVTFGWMSSDPLYDTYHGKNTSFEWGPYTYTLNNPLIYSDPSGLAWQLTKISFGVKGGLGVKAAKVVDVSATGVIAMEIQFNKSEATDINLFAEGKGSAMVLGTGGEVSSKTRLGVDLQHEKLKQTYVYQNRDGLAFYASHTSEAGGNVGFSLGGLQGSKKYSTEHRLDTHGFSEKTANKQEASIGAEFCPGLCSGAKVDIGEKTATGQSYDFEISILGLNVRVGMNKTDEAPQKQQTGGDQ
jgi:RHS repeat-associated protein